MAIILIEEVLGGLDEVKWSLEQARTDMDRSRDLPPDMPSLDHLLAIVTDAEEVVKWTEMREDGPVRGEKSLCVAGGFEPAHCAFPLARGLMRVFGAIVQVPVLQMLHAKQDLALGGATALQLIRLSVMMIRGTQVSPLRRLRKNFLAACLSRHRCTRISSTWLSTPVPSRSQIPGSWV